MSSGSKKIQQLSLKHFTAFEDVTLDFCPGINVLIGANATGKTLMMKLMYALLKICETVRQHGKTTAEEFSDITNSKLQRIFQIHQLHELIRCKNTGENTDQNRMEVRLDFAETYTHLTIERTGNGEQGRRTHVSQRLQLPSSLSLAPLSVYLPAQEFLSINEGFISAYQNRELPYDETYYDLSVALNALPLRNDKLTEIQQVLTRLRTILGGNNGNSEIVTQENGRFYFEFPEGRFESHLVAEGYRKIATLYYLLRNGALTKDCVLFWDEPEANLNPQLIVQVVDILKHLASVGMQIVIATHDYLLSHELSLLVEYPSRTTVDVTFFALHKPEGKAGTVVESGKTLADIGHNPILEEFAAHYDREVSLFQRVKTPKKPMP